MGISEQELEHIKELLFTGDKGNIKLVDILLEQRLCFDQMRDFYERRICPPALRFVGLSLSERLNFRCKESSVFVATIWDYTHFFKSLQDFSRELAFVSGQQLFKVVLDFNLKIKKCTLIYFPSNISEEFVSLVKEMRPDIEVKIDK